MLIIDPTWSLNRVTIADLPGFDIPEWIKGKLSYDLVSSRALTRMIRQRAAAPGIDPHLSDHDARLAFDAALESKVPSIRAAATETARIIGRNLGYVLLTLKRGDNVNRKARPEWGIVQWDHWAQIQQVWLGGGLVSGHLGPFMAQHAGEVMREAGFERFAIRLSPWAVHLPLIGAARHLPPCTRSALILDFGSTRIKRAQMVLESEQLVELRQLPSLPVPWSSVGASKQCDREPAAAVISDMVGVIVQSWQQVYSLGPRAPAGTIPVSVAAYVKDGQPLAAQAGIYMQTNLVTDNLERELEQRVSAKLGDPVSIMVLHDGTAAATTYAGEPHTAVITLGTALGIGFPGKAVGLRPIAIGFKVRTSGAA